jgi:cation diffusion facilitator CzcD-associated flavoprotein CzcO
MPTPPPDRPSTPVALGPGPRYDVLAVGAGLSGMYQPHLLRQLGLSARVFEAGAVGGDTW